MSTVGLSHTLADLRKMMNPDGSIDSVLEILSQDNPILEDCPFQEGNLPTGNKTTVRASLPSPDVRRINRGISPTKGTTKQIADTAMILEARSQVDIELMALAPNPQAYRAAEDDAHVEGMAQYVAALMLYGNTGTDPDEFNGFFARYNTLTGGEGTPGYQVISGGTANANNAVNTSLLLVDWGDRRVTGIYPRGSKAGITVRDLGENDAMDANSKPFRAVTTLYNWKVGLAVHNVRSVARVANIDTAALPSTASAQTALMDKIIVAKNRIFKPKAPVLYCSNTMYTFFEQYLSHKDNMYITRQELMGQMPALHFMGIPIKKVDCFTDTEAAVQ